MSRFPTPVERGVSDDVLVCVYLVALHTVFRNERRGAAAHGVQPLIPGVKGRSLQAAFRTYAPAAVFIVAAGGVLPRVATEIAQQMGWSNTFVP